MSLPKIFCGAATAANQCEGAYNVDGRGWPMSIYVRRKRRFKVMLGHGETLERTQSMFIRQCKESISIIITKKISRF